ncbi:hypothetical protein OMP38_10320 [Cohnella ginsengisoli]|uniref:Beta-galactosidase n=1 Tax=Cohnella ginsengisoli TaxID=425004 RepID=A0A9X4KJW7_9BACL|nr:sugar-binding domain-containing protein [Cohnella ginsengisoli]MDG0791220.1 hypothetical protein [Cohnella ginsengisoli]
MQPRITIGLSSGWTFRVDAGDIGENEGWQASGLPDGRAVAVPHTWNVEEGLEDYRGAAWYAYEFEAEGAWRSKRVRIQFEAVYRDAKVWLNGQLIGGHAGSGYTSFTLDLTAALSFAHTNRLVVRADNRPSEQALPFARSFDWADDGGLIRGVQLIVSGRHAIDFAKIDALPAFTGEPGSPAGMTADGILGGSLYFDRVEAGARPEVSLAVRYDGELLAEERYAVEMQPGARSAKLRELRLDGIKLWHFDRPHLYSLEIAVYDSGGASDRIEVMLGFREIVTEGSRLLLNREPVRLIGVEWMPGSNPEVGMAETAADLIQRLRQMKEANCVITRFHWQQDAQLLDWCDSNGLLVQEEIPHWQQPAAPDDAHLPLALQHAQEMIDRHYNHPSVFAWGMGNELDGQDPHTFAYMGKLKQAFRRLDASRLVNYVSNTVHLDPAGDATGEGDVVMWNDYIGTWHGDLNRQSVIEQITAAYPDKPLAVAEFGLCEPAFPGGDPRRAKILSDNMAEYKRHPEIAIAIYFSLNDYRTQMGEEGEGRLRKRVHGSTDLYGNPKPSLSLLTELASPIQLAEAARYEANQVKVKLTVRDDLPSHAVRGYRFTASVGEGGGATSEAALPIPDTLPGESVELIFEAAPGATRIPIRIVRPNGFVALAQEIAID